MSARAWVVSGTIGRYSDQRWWVACVAMDSAEVAAIVARLNAAAKMRPDGEAFTTDEDEDAALAAWQETMADAGDGSGLHYCDCYWRDIPKYSAVDVPVTSPLARLKR